MDDNGLGKEISETVERVFCRLSGREPPLFAASTSDAQRQEKEKEQEENPASTSKKRTLDEMNEGREKFDTGSDDAPAASSEKDPVSNSKT